MAGADFLAPRPLACQHTRYCLAMRDRDIPRQLGVLAKIGLHPLP